MEINDKSIDQAAKIVAGVGGTGVIGWFLKRFVYPLISARNKKLVSEEEKHIKANQSLVEQSERLEAEITRLSEKLKKRDEKIEKLIEEKNDLQHQLFDLRSQMGNEYKLLTENAELKRRVDISEARIKELEQLLSDMAQAQQKIVSSD